MNANTVLRIGDDASNKPRNFLLTADSIIIQTPTDDEGEFVHQKRKHIKRAPTNITNPELFRLSSVNGLSLTKKVQRAGIIPYTVVENGDVVFGFGIDARSGDYSDWGGGFSRRCDILPLMCAIREFHEEILGIASIKIRDLKYEPCIVKDGVMILFVYFDPTTLFSMPSEFKRCHTLQSQYSKLEMSGMKLIFGSKVMDEINLGRIYCVISKPLISHLSGVIQMIQQNGLHRS